MAYETGTATSLEDLMLAVHTFAVAQGWTSNIYNTTNDWMAINNGSVFVQFRWDNANAIAMFQSTGFINTSTAPGNHTNSSGLGQVDATAPYNSTISGVSTSNSTTPRMQMRTYSNGPFTAYHLFTDGTTKYIHLAVEVTPGVFTHMSFGTINKRGDWVGGEYAAGHDIGVSASSIFGHGISHNASQVNGVNFSIRAEGLPSQGTGRWLCARGFSITTGNNSAGNDPAGNPRGEAVPTAFGFGVYANLMAMAVNPGDGLVPLYPIEVFRKHLPAADNEQCILLGTIPGVRTINMNHFQTGSEFSIGASTFIALPAHTRGGAGSPGLGRGFRGLAYLKVV